MKVQEIINKLEERYPLACAEEWDNPGLLIGRTGAEVERVMVALDALDSVIDEAIDVSADLIVTHHPLIFHPVANVCDEDFLGRRILTLAENRIALYAMHTNFDVRKMADLNAAQLQLTNTKVLDVTGTDAYDLEEGLGKVGELSEPMPLSEFAKFVKGQMQLDNVRCYWDPDEDPEIRTVAVCGGAGGSVISCALAAGAQVLVTGDISHHAAIDAMAQGLALIDAGHYGTEICFVDHMQRELSELFPELEVLSAKSNPPFRVI